MDPPLKDSGGSAKRRFEGLKLGLARNRSASAGRFFVACEAQRRRISVGTLSFVFETLMWLSRDAGIVAFVGESADEA